MLEICRIFRTTILLVWLLSSALGFRITIHREVTEMGRRCQWFGGTRPPRYMFPSFQGTRANIKSVTSSTCQFSPNHNNEDSNDRSGQQPLNQTSPGHAFFGRSKNPNVASLQKAMAATEVADVEFCSFEEISNKDRIASDSEKYAFPYASILQASAGYIADHLDRVAVFYIPSQLLKMPISSTLMEDIALSWTLGLKLVLVVGCCTGAVSYSCMVGGSTTNGNQNLPHSCNDEEINSLEHEAGYIRFEVEREMNKHLRKHGGMSPSNPNAPLLSGNVVGGGSFYTASPYECIDLEHSGFTERVHTERIQNVLDNNDVVLLTTVGFTRLGDAVTVNGNHLAASVAAALGARKLVFLSSNGGVLRRRREKQSLQDVSIDLAKSLLDFHQVTVSDDGRADVEMSRSIDERSSELLLHIAWSTWALELGVHRAHVVNPYDGALLEEFFTTKNGVNTCIFCPEEADDLHLTDDLLTESFD